MRSRARILPICAAILCGLVLRAFIPAGYMPASAGSGLLFELCPDQLPPGVTFAAGGHEHHHHHHHESEEAAGDACDLGHILANAWIDAPAYELSIADARFEFDGTVVLHSTTIVARPYYASRAPPVS